MSAPAAPRLRTVFLHDFVLNAEVGFYPEEHARRQRVRLQINLSVHDTPGYIPQKLEDVVDYAAVADRIRAVTLAGHVVFVEDLAERVAATCFADERVLHVRVRVEKLDAFDDIGSAGIEIERARADCRPPPPTPNPPPSS